MHSKHLEVTARRSSNFLGHSCRAEYKTCPLDAAVWPGSGIHYIPLQHTQNPGPAEQPKAQRRSVFRNDTAMSIPASSRKSDSLACNALAVGVCVPSHLQNNSGTKRPKSDHFPTAVTGGPGSIHDSVQSRVHKNMCSRNQRAACAGRMDGDECLVAKGKCTSGRNSNYPMLQSHVATALNIGCAGLVTSLGCIPAQAHLHAGVWAHMLRCGVRMSVSMCLHWLHLRRPAAHAFMLSAAVGLWALGL